MLIKVVNVAKLARRAAEVGAEDSDGIKWIGFDVKAFDVRWFYLKISRV